MKDHKLWLCEDSADNETEIKSQVNEHNELIVWYISPNNLRVIK